MPYQLNGEENDGGKGNGQNSGGEGDTTDRSNGEGWGTKDKKPDKNSDPASNKTKKK
jgi:hypothetical protein